MTSSQGAGWRPTVTLWVLAGAFGILMLSMVIGALRKPKLATGTVTAPHPLAVGDSLVGPSTYTVDATSETGWTFFDFSRNAVVTAPGPLDWDLAFRRYHVIANGGAGFAGQGAIADLGEVGFDSVTAAPEGGYEVTARDSMNPATARWYDYGYASHLLPSRGRVYAVRTADGKYAKIAIVSYYCGETMSGCPTFRYVYQGNGTRLLGR